MYGSVYDLQRHIKRHCPDRDDDDDEAPSKRMKREDAPSNEAFDALINQAYDQYDDRFQKIIQDLLEEGVSEKKARKIATKKLIYKYAPALREKYSSLLKIAENLKDSPLHMKVMNTIEKFVDNGIAFNQAVNLSLRKNSYLFDDLLVDESDSSSSSEEEESDEESSTNNSSEESSEESLDDSSDEFDNIVS